MAKAVSGKKYAAADEKFNKKALIKDEKSMKTAGIANALKKAKKDQGPTKRPKVKPQKKK